MPSHPDTLVRELLDEISRWPIFDPHSHIDAHRPAARDLDEVLGYHYYTELAHSAGMPAELVGPDVPKKTRAQHLSQYLDRLDNTVQFSWLSQIAETFHSHSGPINRDTIDALYASADHSRDGEAWDEHVWKASNLEAVFLTNEFDDPLEGWDTSRYIPCLRTDDLVLKLHLPETVDRLKRATNVDVQDEKSLRIAIGALFGHFVNRGARACAISLPPDFVPLPGTPKQAVTPIRRALHGMELRPDEHDEIRRCVFWTLAEFCAEFALPFDLMIGPIRGVYPAGVAGGRDLFDRRVSLYEYRHLFNHFSNVVFPISTLSPDAGPELVAYSWIFPNVVPMGHWWYSNIPAFIAPDLKARLQALPKTKPIGYYSDAYKLEFVLPKVTMYRRLLAETLAEDAIRARGLSQDAALEIARHVLIDNPKRVFAKNGGKPVSLEG